MEWMLLASYFYLGHPVWISARFGNEAQCTAYVAVIRRNMIPIAELRDFRWHCSSSD